MLDFLMEEHTNKNLQELSQNTTEDEISKKENEVKKYF